MFKKIPSAVVLSEVKDISVTALSSSDVSNGFSSASEQELEKLKENVLQWGSD